MPTISLIGPGAIGGTLAAWLIDNPENHVSICARSPFRDLIVTTPDRTLASWPRVVTDPASAEATDWIILATKTYQIASAAIWLESLCGSRTRVAVAQNGVEHIANLARFIDPGHIVPVIIDCPAERSGPGRVIQRGEIKMAVPNDRNAKDFAALFDDPSIKIALSDSWISEAWKKLCLNCSGAICVLVDQPANIAKNPQAANVMRSLIRECIAVGRAEGATIGDEIIEAIVTGQAAAPDGAKNSLHADFVERRPMEWDARNGVIARIGEKHGIPTPYNRMAADLLSLLESNYASSSDATATP